MVFLCGICLFPRKRRFSFLSLTNSYLSIYKLFATFRYSVEYLNILQSVPVLNLFNDQDHLNSIVNEPVFISGKIMKKTVSCENNRFIRNRSTNVHNMKTWQTSGCGIFSYDGSWRFHFYIFYTHIMKSN